MSVDTMPDNLEISDITKIFGVILSLGLLIWALYSWINPPILIVCSIAGFIIVHGIAVLLFGSENRPSRITYWGISTILLLVGAIVIGTAVRLSAFKPRIMNLWDNLPMFVKMALNPIWFTVALIITIILLIACVIWLVSTVESLWPQRKMYML